MDIEERLAALEARLVALEDERAVQAHLVRYGLVADIGDADAMAALFAEDCHVDIDKTNYMDGREEARRIVDCEPHRAILPNASHVMGPFVVSVQGDYAVATGYATVLLKSGGRSEVARQSFGRWELNKQDGCWLITRRVSRSAGRTDTGEVLRGGVDPTAAPPAARPAPVDGNKPPEWNWPDRLNKSHGKV